MLFGAVDWNGEEAQEPQRPSVTSAVSSCTWTETFSVTVSLRVTVPRVNLCNARRDSHNRTSLLGADTLHDDKDLGVANLAPAIDKVLQCHESIQRLAYAMSERFCVHLAVITVSTLR